MSHQLISHSPDLNRLRNEGFDIEIESNYLTVRDVPFVTTERAVACGMIISELSVGGQSTIRPGNHTIFFAGGVPCNTSGVQLKQINSVAQTTLAEGIVSECTFSSKPREGYYSDYYAKINLYVNMISGYAQALDPTVTAKTFPVVRIDDENYVFRYLDSASSRAGISFISDKLALPRVAIVGLGGTGSYILDLIAKTHLREIHLYDDDRFHAHNAFRAPGAASVEDLDVAPFKVDYYFQKYNAMRTGIVAHPVRVNASNVIELGEMRFVFLAMDSGPDKRIIVEELEGLDVPFIDVGMGLFRTDDKIDGIVRVTTSTAGRRDHVWKRQRISFADSAIDDYHNLQVADLNMLNAVLAVIKWKKLFGFYVDEELEHFSTYTVGGNQLLNDEGPP